MADLLNEILKGKKSFFITPDGSLISEYFCLNICIKITNAILSIMLIPNPFKT